MHCLQNDVRQDRRPMLCVQRSHSCEETLPFPPLAPPPPPSHLSPHYRKHRGVRDLVTDNNHTSQTRKPKTYSGFCSRRNGIAASCYWNARIPVDIGFVCLSNAYYTKAFISKCEWLLNILEIMSCNNFFS